VLASLFEKHDPSVIGNDYLVMGTVEGAAWHEGMKQPKGIDDILAPLHDFKEVLTLEYRPAGWYPADEAERRKKAPDRPAAPVEQTVRHASLPSSSRKRKRRKKSKLGH
jgi:hypothetical protein